MNSLPKEVRFTIPDGHQETFAKLNTLAVLREKKLPELFAEMAEFELLHAASEMTDTWLPWNEFADRMAKEGFNLNRTTFWVYRNNGTFEGLVKSNGVTTLFQLEGILAFYRGETAETL